MKVSELKEEIKQAIEQFNEENNCIVDEVKLNIKTHKGKCREETLVQMDIGINIK
jgi:hypothetical protein